MTSTHMSAFAAHRSTARHRTVPGMTLQAIADALHLIGRSYVEGIETRRAIRELEQLDDRTLRDIGLTPTDIDPANIRATMNRCRGA